MSKFTRLFQLKKRRLCAKQVIDGKKINSNVSKLNFIILVLVVIVGITYLFLINKVSTSGFEIKALEQRIEELKQKNKKLELEAVHLQSLQEISQAIDQLQLSKLDQIEYLTTSTPSVARSR